MSLSFYQVNLWQHCWGVLRAMRDCLFELRQSVDDTGWYGLSGRVDQAVEFLID